MNYKIILMLFLTLFFINSVYATPITKFGAVQSGSIGNGNGYYDNELGFTNVTSNRNIYIATEPDMITIVEPLGYPLGISGATQLVGKGAGTGNLKFGFVASDGYLYFTDTEGIKRKLTRSDNTLVYANDTLPGGSVLYLYSGTISKLFEFENQIYFFDGTNLKYFSSPDYTPVTAITGVTQGQDFSVVSESGELTVYVSLITSLVNATTAHSRFNLLKSTSTVKNTLVYDTYGISGACGGCSLQIANSSIFITSNYIYSNFYGDYGDGGATHRIIQSETVLYRSNYSVYSTDGYTAVHPNWRSDAYNVGGYSVFAMYAKTTTTYDIFSFVEIGVLNVAGVPVELTYDTKTIQSMQSTYYNRSDIYLEYNVVIDSLDTANLLFLSDFGDYRWMISLTDPNGVTQDIVQSPACSYDGILDPTCQVTSTMGIHAPSNGWLAGTWYAKLYEVNIVNPNRALLSTSTAFTVLNTSLENQSIAPPPFIPPTAGTSPQTISIIDGVVGYFNIGVNATSKLLFAMVVIALFLILGLSTGKSDIAIVLAFIPYAFFTYIDYIPKWIFIIFIILLAIYSKVFR